MWMNMCWKTQESSNSEKADKVNINENKTLILYHEILRILKKNDNFTKIGCRTILDNWRILEH